MKDINLQDKVAIITGGGRGIGREIALVMAGGFGKRLGDITKTTPKPLLKLGKEPLLETLLKKLEDSNFNKAKSDLKFIEACAFGIPSVMQDLCTYDAAFHKFKTAVVFPVS